MFSGLCFSVMHSVIFVVRALLLRYMAFGLYQYQNAEDILHGSVTNYHSYLQSQSGVMSKNE
jgi:hypothetical protein